MLPSNRRRDSSQNSSSTGKTNSTRILPAQPYGPLFQGHGHRRAKHVARGHEKNRDEKRAAKRTATNENKHADALQRRPYQCKQGKRGFRHEGKQNRREEPWQTLEGKAGHPAQENFFSRTRHTGPKTDDVEDRDIPSNLLHFAPSHNIVSPRFYGPRFCGVRWLVVESRKKTLSP